MKYAIEETSLVDIANALRRNLHYDGGAIVEAMPDMIDAACDIAKTEGYTDGYNDGYEQGKESELMSFWTNYQDAGNRENYQLAFSREGWNDVTFNPQFNITPTNCAQMFQQCKITDVEAILKRNGVTLDTSGSTNFLQMIQSSTITVLPKIDATKATSFNYAFARETLKIIRELVVSETTPFSNTFASGLEEIIVSGTIGQNGFSIRSSNLNKASIESIINALSTTTSGLTVTLSLTAVKKAFETSEGANDGNTSAEWVSLTGTRSNWTISLS